MHAALQLSANYHTPVSYWVGLPLAELYAWAQAAREISEENAGDKGQTI